MAEVTHPCNEAMGDYASGGSSMNGLERMAFRAGWDAAMAALSAVLPDFTGAHYVDIVVRRNGRDIRYEGDFLRRLK